MEDPKSHEHWQGTKNKLIRYWYYCTKGLDIFNQFRYVVMMIFGIYWAMKLKNPVMLLGMFAIFIPVLTAIGYYAIHHINKVQDWLQVRFGSYYTIYNFKLLEDIREYLKKIHEAGPQRD